jgi:hypothetical protein
MKYQKRAHAKEKKEKNTRSTRGLRLKWQCKYQPTATVSAIASADFCHRTKYLQIPSEEEKLASTVHDKGGRPGTDDSLVDLGRELV